MAGEYKVVSEYQGNLPTRIIVNIYPQIAKILIFPKHSNFRLFCAAYADLKARSDAIRWRLTRSFAVSRPCPNSSRASRMTSGAHEMQDSQAILGFTRPDEPLRGQSKSTFG